MTITREQVKDLQPGDVVERAYDVDPDTVTRGPLRAYPDGSLRLAEEVIRHRDGGAWNGHLRLLTVVSRAPRPLYVNHPRTEPVAKDVVRDGEGVIRHCDAAGFGGEPTWWSWNYEPGWKWTYTTRPPQPLTLLVDGETGQVVQ